MSKVIPSKYCGKKNSVLCLTLLRGVSLEFQGIDTTNTAYLPSLNIL
jgi:hypothetical protein